MIVSPALGIGDLLILKMRSLEFSEPISAINLQESICRIYYADSEQHKIFIVKFINLLFPNVPLNIITTDGYNVTHLRNIKINKTYLYDQIESQLPSLPDFDSPYLIFHSKLRLDGFVDLFLTHDLPKLVTFLENFKTSLTIVIMGEKNIESNIETRTHNIQSLYTHLLKLEKNNHVLDCSHDNLCSGNLDFDNFLSEIVQINQAVVNITFGYGGPLNICQAFSRQNLAYVSGLQHEVLSDYIRINKNLYSNIDDFLEQINKYALI